MYENINTKKRYEIVKTETVSNPPITVYTLDDGVRWEMKLFHKYHRIVEERKLSNDGREQKETKE